jgi:trimeric autotransporter adhesin
MKKPILFCLALIFISNHLFAQPANDICANATNLGTLSGNYTATSGNLYLANQTNPNATCGNRYDVFYRFTLPAGSTSVIITAVLNVPNAGTGSLTTSNTYIELFNTSGCTLTTSIGGCNNISQSRKYTGLTSGGTYTFRINTTQNPNVLAQGYYGFNLFVVPNNEECNNVATILPAGGTVSGNLAAATNSGVAVAPCTGTADDDIWYSFTALYNYATITLGNIGSDLATSGARMQLFSGTCGSLSSLACSGTTNIINATGLTPGNTYYVRVYSAGAGQTGSNWGFQISLSPSAKVQVGSGRMKEVFHQQIISAPQVLADPWEVTYGPDNKLWITESKGYRVYRMDPTTGVRDTVLNISQGSTFFTAPADVAFNCQFNNGSGAQGGLAGLALHPKFLDPVTPKNFVYISYIHSSNGGSSPTGLLYTNRLVRFTYNTGTGRLESPVSLCDTLPGSNDHNSQRMIIAPDTSGNGLYLYYASGDMGAGQFSNRTRPQRAQLPGSYEGKILRFNLESDGDAGLGAWIPNNNPYSATSAVYSIGIRNNQGFAFDTSLNKLYGSSHGPYSDDEINEILPFKNYGHPIVIGYVDDGNYNGNTVAGTSTSVSAGAAFNDNSGNSSCPPVGNEATNRAAIDAGPNGLYKDPLFSAYAGPTSGPLSVATIWATPPAAGNGVWPSEGWSGLDLYSNKLIPGWKRSLVAASLKWGRLVRLKLGATGNTTLPSNAHADSDTISYFGSTNRFRDLAFSPNGKDIYVVMDRSISTSGPSAANPVVTACQGCVQKYTFLGYADNAGKSSIPVEIDVTDGIVNTCNDGTTITIDNTNNNIWVPITGPDGNIMAEINAMGQNLGAVTSSFYKNGGAIRVRNSFYYLDRNITITPAVTSFAIPVKVRLYISKAEFDALDAHPSSGITSGIGQLKVLKNDDPCGNAVNTSTTLFNPTNSGADLVHGPNGYVLQTAVPGFSTFYFGASNITLPLDLVYFKGSLQNNATQLQWETINESSTSHFIVERSLDGQTFNGIGNVKANNTASSNKYDYSDNDVNTLGASVLYYRLKMVDIDGQFKYSNVVTIYLADITTLSLTPNPTAGETKLMINAANEGSVSWKLRDNSGRVVMHNTIHLRRGANNVTLNVGGLAGGLYFLHVSGMGINQNLKLQKL